MAQFYNFGPGGQNVTMNSQALSWDGATNLSAYGTITGSIGSYSITNPGGWIHQGWCIIHQTQGTGAGQWEVNWINFANNTTRYALSYDYVTGAQVITLSNAEKAYNNLTINGAVTVPAWNGSTGGIGALLCRDTFLVNSSCYISADGVGYRGGASHDTDNGDLPTTNVRTGESSASASLYYTNGTANGNGGGAGWADGNSSSGTYCGTGAGGGNGAVGSAGSTYNSFSVAGAASSTAGNASLSSFVLGGGGGGTGASANAPATVGTSGTGGGGIIIIAKNIVINGNLVARGNASQGSVTFSAGAGGGGSILLKAKTATLGSSLCVATGGTAGTGSITSGGNGGTGRIHLDYYASYTGTASPALDVSQNLSLIDSTNSFFFSLL